MSLLYKRASVGEVFQEELDNHFLVEVFARVFPKHLKAMHGYEYRLVDRKTIVRFESPQACNRFGHEVTVYFRSDQIEPKLGYLKPIPHSWLLHETSGTIINPIPLGGEPMIDYPTRHAPHPDAPLYNPDRNFELLKDKLPSPERVEVFWKKFEMWMKEENVDMMMYVPLK